MPRPSKSREIQFTKPIPSRAEANKAMKTRKILLKEFEDKEKPKQELVNYLEEFNKKYDKLNDRQSELEDKADEKISALENKRERALNALRIKLDKEQRLLEKASKKTIKELEQEKDSMKPTPEKVEPKLEKISKQIEEWAKTNYYPELRKADETMRSFFGAQAILLEQKLAEAKTEKQKTELREEFARNYFKAHKRSIKGQYEKWEDIKRDLLPSDAQDVIEMKVGEQAINDLYKAKEEMIKESGAFEKMSRSVKRLEKIGKNQRLIDQIHAAFGKASFSWYENEVKENLKKMDALIDKANAIPEPDVQMS
jgi:hypothetical protein